MLKLWITNMIMLNVPCKEKDTGRCTEIRGCWSRCTQLPFGAEWTSSFGTSWRPGRLWSRQLLAAMARSWSRGKFRSCRGSPARRRCTASSLKSFVNIQICRNEANTFKSRLEHFAAQFAAEAVRFVVQCSAAAALAREVGLAGRVSSRAAADCARADCWRRLNSFMRNLFNWKSGKKICFCDLLIKK